MIAPVEITRDNDLTFSVGPIRGRDPADNIMKYFEGTQLDGWIASAADSDTALGASKTFTVIGTSTFIPFFEASEVNAALTAAGALTAEQRLWCVLKAANEFRVAIPLVYRDARVA